MRGIHIAIMMLAVLPCGAQAQTMDQGMDVGQAAAQIRGDSTSAGNIGGDAGISTRPMSAEEVRQKAFSDNMSAKLRSVYWGEHMAKVNAARKRKGLPPMSESAAPTVVAKPAEVIDTPQGQMQIVP